MAENTLKSNQTICQSVRINQQKIATQAAGTPDIPIAWTRHYGLGRVFYSSIGHTRSSWRDPDVQKMYLEAIRWGLGLTSSGEDE